MEEEGLLDDDFDDKIKFDRKNDEVKIIYIEKPKLEE